MKKITTIALIMLMSIISITNIYAYENDEISFEIEIIDDEAVVSTATIDDNFCDSTIIVTFNHRASLSLNEIKNSDFDGLDIKEIMCITPGIEQVREYVEAVKEKDVETVTEIRESTWQVNVEYFRKIVVIRLATSGKQEVLSAIGYLQGYDNIIAAEPNFIHFLPNNSATRSSIMQTNTSIEPSSSRTQWALNSARVEEAWNFFGPLNRISFPSTIRVGVLDSGIDYNHPELNVCREVSYNFASGSHGNYYRDVSMVGHGTMTAGIIGARGEQMRGVAPGVQLVSLRIAGSAGGGTAIVDSYVVRAINHATIHRIPILNFSNGWGGTGPGPGDAVRRAIRMFPGLFVAGRHYGRITDSRVYHTSILNSLRVVNSYLGGIAGVNHHGLLFNVVAGPGTRVEISQSSDFNLDPRMGLIVGELNNGDIRHVGAHQASLYYRRLRPSQTDYVNNGGWGWVGRIDGVNTIV